MNCRHGAHSIAVACNHIKRVGSSIDQIRNDGCVQSITIFRTGGKNGRRSGCDFRGDLNVIFRHFDTTIMNRWGKFQRDHTICASCTDSDRLFRHGGGCGGSGNYGCDGCARDSNQSRRDMGRCHVTRVFDIIYRSIHHQRQRHWILIKHLTLHRQCTRGTLGTACWPNRERVDSRFKRRCVAEQHELHPRRAEPSSTRSARSVGANITRRYGVITRLSIWCIWRWWWLYVGWNVERSHWRTRGTHMACCVCDSGVEGIPMRSSQCNGAHSTLFTQTCGRFHVHVTTCSCRHHTACIHV